MRLLHKRGVMTPEMIDEKQVRAMVDEYSSIFNSAVSYSISKGIESGVIPEEMKRRLDDDVYLFSGFKTYHELKEASSMLRDTNGQLKPFNRFYNDISAIKQDYNKNWLQAEYIFATQSSVMAAKWKDQEADSDRYNLQYRTAGDGRVRPEHRVLDKTTLPASNPFWNEYYPPNGWRCRCTVVQVRKGKYPETDSNTAMQQGREATYEAGKNGTNKAAIFRFNPGKQQVIFPPHHPYYADQCAACKKHFVAKLTIDVNSKEYCRMCQHLTNAGNFDAEGYAEIHTSGGKLRIHQEHGKTERKDNIKVASYFTDKYNHDIDLLPRDNNAFSADAFNRTLGHTSEYKVNEESTRNSIDKALKKGSKQAHHVVFWFNHKDIQLETISNALADRARRCKDLEYVTIIINEKDHTYSIDEILEKGFKIKQTDMK